MSMGNDLKSIMKKILEFRDAGEWGQCHDPKNLSQGSGRWFSSSSFHNSSSSPQVFGENQAPVKGVLYKNPLTAFFLLLKISLDLTGVN